ncbi:MAG: hypothetical protein ACLQVN_08585 [Bryobacteraceae bacterium]
MYRSPKILINSIPFRGSPGAVPFVEVWDIGVEASAIRQQSAGKLNVRLNEAGGLGPELKKQNCDPRKPCNFYLLAAILDSPFERLFLVQFCALYAEFRLPLSTAA